MMQKRVLVLGVLNATSETICFRFREHGYRVHFLALAFPQEVALWQRKMQGADCEIAAEAFDIAMAARALEIDPSGWQKADLAIFIDADATLSGILIEQCVHLEQIIRVEQDAYDMPLLSLSSSSLRINKIRAVNLASNNDEHRDIASSLHEMLLLERGQAYEVAMLALYLASSDAIAITDVVIDIPAGRYLS